MRAAAALLVLALGALVLLAGGPPALEAWLPGFILGLGLLVGALIALMTGHILGEEWLEPVRPALEAMARTAPLVALLAMPVLVAPGWIYPWAADPSLLDGPRAVWFAVPFFRARLALILAAMVLLAALLARPGQHVRASTAGLALLLPGGFVAAQDLVLSRDLGWFGSLQGTALMVEQLAAALSAAVLAALWRGGVHDRGGLRGLERTLLALAMLTLWLWFVQFVVAWMADLPAEAGWYLRRGGGWLLLKLGVLVPALVAVIAIAIPPRSGRRRIGAIALLLLGQHVGQVWWLLRPGAPGEAPPPWLDLALATGLMAAWAAWWWRGLVRPGAGPAGGARPARASVR